jgi:hypothetical protein
MADEPQRILMTADTVGGVWMYAVELARGLAPHGVEVVLATMGRAASPEQRREIRALGNVQLFENPARLEWMDKPWADVDRAGEWLLELEERWQPDLIISTAMHTALCPGRRRCSWRRTRAFCPGGRR